ncbi:LOW QUALITY PROTEIN: hormone-sensitive lipase-like, partial [Leucoraja erinacea]|uniref:LOW QUALITY PROTEIN: hormone-sensitive lipase-like n=1 Tax=Leucoraja erinaceus TaxID=7782 RepID=UPI002458A781
MDTRTMFLLLHSVTEDNARYFRQQRSEPARRFAAAFSRLQEDGRGLQPLLAAMAPHFSAHDLDLATPANGYRSLSKVVRRCVMHAVHKSRYVAASRRSVFFRAGHNLMEVEAYSSALRQLRALVYFAHSLLAANRHGDLFFSDHERGLSDEFLRESNTMHKGCFYGRCLGFQFSPSIRPFLQTISIGLVSFGENYRKHESKLGIAATSIFTSGKYAIDPELRGAEFERLTQVTDTIAMPLAVDPTLTVAITPPVAHCGPGPVQMRLISYELRDGQVPACASTPHRTPRCPVPHRTAP